MNLELLFCRFEMIAYRWVSSGSTHLGPFPGDSADAVALVEQRLIRCRKQGVFKQLASLLALPPQRGEGLALVGNHHPPADDTSGAYRCKRGPLRPSEHPPAAGKTTPSQLLLAENSSDSWKSDLK